MTRATFKTSDNPRKQGPTRWWGITAALWMALKTHGGRLCLFLFALSLLFIFVPTASAARRVNQCEKYKTAVANGDTLTCILSSATNGNKVIVAGYYYGTTKTLVCTIACTCPTNANIANSYTGTNNQTLFICYVDVNSTADLTVTLTVSCTAGCTTLAYLQVQEWDGLSVGDDSGSEASAATQTVNFTSANSSELAFSAVFDLSNIVIPASGFSPVHQMSDNSQPGIVNARTLSTQSKLLGASGSYTSSYTVSGSTQPLISVIAFQTSGGSNPTVKVVQSCSFMLAASTTGVSAKCPLVNVSNGNTVVFEEWNNTTVIGNQGGSCPEQACSLITGTQVHQGSVTSGIGYVELAANYTTFRVGAGIINTGSAIGGIQAYEISGIGNVDAGSAAVAAATHTVNYTTAANNEWAFMIALESAQNVMTPGNSFLPLNIQNGEAAVVGASLTAARTVASAGAQTASYTQSGGTENSIAVVAFTIGPFQRVRHKAQVIKYHQLKRAKSQRPKIILAKAGVH